MENQVQKQVTHESAGGAESAEIGSAVQTPPPFQLFASGNDGVVQRQVIETTEGLVGDGHRRSAPADIAADEESPLTALAEEVPALEPALAPALGSEGRPIDDAMRTEARDRYRIPERGWDDHVVALNRPRNMNLARSIDDLSELIRNNPAAIEHIRHTIDAFLDDPDPDSRLRPEDIDIPLILSIANRESMGRPVFLPPAGGDEAAVEEWGDTRVTTGGGDAIRGGVGGLDNMGNRINRFPTSMRDDVRSTMDVPSLRARIRPNRMGRVNPAELPQRDLLAAYVAGVHIYQERFETQFRQRVTRGNAERGQAFTEEQANRMLSQMGTDARRAWIQASFGSRLGSLLSGATRPMLARYRREFRNLTPEEAFNIVLNDDNLNLNCIITNDALMNSADLSGHRTRLTAAEAWMMEESLPSDLLDYRRTPDTADSEAPTTTEPATSESTVTESTAPAVE